MNKCRICGKENSPKSVFCTGCGTKLEPDIDAVVKQAVAKKTSGTNKRNVTGVVIIAVIALIIFIAVKSADSAEIKKVKNTDIGLSSMGVNITYGQLLDGYCKSEKWEKFTSNTYSKVVEFTGKTSSGDEILIQFSDQYGVYDGKYVVVYAEVNGRSVGDMEMVNWFMNAAYDVGY
ncbi:MAG: zinc ribbon domain-containing protein [Oscillospiraceae bacterium]|jgi:hypothetical protein|nr:zinc ribbon domain-containing protein [Oscillospiraceae bacterium]